MRNMNSRQCSRLKALMKRTGRTNESMADFLGIEVELFEAKLNLLNQEDFYFSESRQIMRALGISANEVSKYFFE